MFNSRDAEMISKQMVLGAGAQEKDKGQVQMWVQYTHAVYGWLKAYTHAVYRWLKARE